MTFWILLGLHLAYLCWLPIFPSQDGGGHVYYAGMLRELWRGSPVYTGYYEVRHFLPPYSAAPYLLACLMNWFDSVLAEKLVVGLYTVLFCLGFRFLVRSLSGSKEVVSLFCFPFVYHSMVYAGFYSFILGSAGVLWFAGMWLRWHDRLTWSRSALVFVALASLLLTHAVPFLVALLWQSLHVCMTVWLTSRGEAGPWHKRWRLSLTKHGHQVTQVCAGFLASLYLTAFLQPGAKVSWPSQSWQVRMHELFLGYALAPIQWRSLRLLLLASTAGAGALACYAVTRRWRSRQFEAADSVLLFALICFGLYFLVPAEANGGAALHSRLPLFGIAFLAVAASRAAIPRRGWVALFGGLTGVAILFLVVQVGVITPVARNAAAVLYAPPVAPGSMGAIITEPDTVPAYFSFNPYMWIPGHYFARYRAILVNSPWSGFEMIIFKPHHPMPYDDQNPLPMTRLLSSTIQPALGRPTPDLDFAFALRRPARREETPEILKIVKRFDLTPVGRGNDVVGFYLRSGRPPDLVGEDPERGFHETR